MNTKRKAEITLVAIILGLIVSPAVAIEESTVPQDLANFETTDKFYQNSSPIFPNESQQLSQ